MPVTLTVTALLQLILFSCLNDLKQSNQFVVRASRSGIYIDNGVDQTIMHRLLDDDEKIDASHDILEFLGLMERPPRKKHNNLSLRKSAPQFLLDVYNRIKEEEESNDKDDYVIPKSRRRKRDINHNYINNKSAINNNDDYHYDDDYNDDDNFITDLDKRAIDQSDTIITFLHKYHHVDEIRMRHNHGRRLWFDVSDVSNDNYLMMAELRIYQNPLYTKRSVIHEMFTITVYNIVPKLTKTTATTLAASTIYKGHKISNDGNKINDDAANNDIYNNLMDDYELRVLSTVNTTTNYQGWLELNVTEGLNAWLLRSQPNLGLYVSAHVINQPEKEFKLNDIGLIYTQRIMQQQQQQQQHRHHHQHQEQQQQNDIDEYQPFLIGFFRGPELIKTTKRRSRKKRNVHTRRRKKSEVINPLFEYRSDSVRSCQMQTLYINFKDLDWHDWIIAPDGYGAFYCSGECNFPLNAHMNATNHAIVQTLVHLLEPKKVPKPCCAPTRLGALPVLYHLNEENVNLKKYKNMIVKSCGCH